MAAQLPVLVESSRVQQWKGIHGNRGVWPSQVSCPAGCRRVVVDRRQCLKYSTRRIVGGISAVRSIRSPNRNARIVSFIAESGSIVAAHRTPSH